MVGKGDAARAARLPMLLAPVGGGVALLMVLTGCGSGDQTPPIVTGSSASASPSTPAAPPSTASPVAPTSSAITKVLVVVEENHSLGQMTAGMPYLAGLAATYGYATHSTAITHPSEPNYLAIAGGSTFGVTSDDPVSVTAPKVGDAPSVFDQAIAAGRGARTYVDAMPANCDPSSSGRAPVKHNPWVFFGAGHANCLRYDVPAGEPGSGSLSSDIAADNLPEIGLVVPSLDHDAHDGSLRAADAWLQQFLAPLLVSTDFTSGRLVVVVTADEDDDNTADNRVLTVVLHPSLSHVVVASPITHYSLTRLFAEVAGVPPLGEGASAPDLAVLFRLPIG